MRRAKTLYIQLEKLLVEKCYVAQSQSDTICRRGHRKEWAWKRHIIDLCEYVLESCVVDNETKEILEKSIQWAKT